MPIAYNIATIILIITMFQGVYLGGVLLFGRNSKHPTTWLGACLMVFALGLGYDIIRNANLLEVYPELYFLPIKSYYLPVPMAYLFVRKLTPDPLVSKDYAWLLLGIIEMAILIILFFLPVEMKSSLENYGAEAEFYFMLYRHLWIPFSLYLLYRCYKTIKANRTRFLNFFSGSQDQMMRWLLRSCIFIGIFCCCFLTKFFVSEFIYNTYIFPINSILILLVIFWTGTWGIKQSFIDFDYSEIPVEEIKKRERRKLHPDEADQKKLEQEAAGMLTLETLRMYIEQHKPYRDPELTLDTLSKASKIPARQISSSINQFAKVNFNTFINQFRVAEAQRMLKSEKYSNLNILGIGFEVGFNSKATFYAAFKKIAGMTPAQWQKQD